MEPFVHALTGALVALAVEPARPRPGFAGRPVRVAAGVTAALLPDVTRLPMFSDPQAILAGGDGWTHSLVTAPVWALLLALVFALLVRRPREWPMFLTITGPALLSHLALDLMTATGIQLWYPLAPTRYAVPLLFPVDLLLVGGLALVAGFALWRPRFARWLAIGAFAAGAGYMVALANWRDEALGIGARMAAERGIVELTVQVFPQPFSPLNWQVLIIHTDAIDVAWISLRRAASGTDANAPDHPLGALAAVRSGYPAPDAARWEQSFRFGADGGRAEFARSAWGRPEFTRFRRFSVYTVLSHVEYRADSRQVCAWFYDARFKLPNVEPSYRFGSCQHMDDRTWSVQRAPGPFAFF